MQVLVHVSTYQDNPFWYRFFEPQPYGRRVLRDLGSMFVFSISWTFLQAMVGFFFMVLTNASTGATSELWFPARMT